MTPFELGACLVVLAAVFSYLNYTLLKLPTAIGATALTLAAVLEALRVGQQALPDYQSKFSRHDFTQPQLFAALALKAFLNTDCRGVAQLLDAGRTSGGTSG